MNPNDEYFVPIPSQSIIKDGKEIILDNQQYDKYLEMRGNEIIKKWDSSSAWMPDSEYAKPSQNSIKRLKRIIARAHSKAKRQILKEIE